MNENFLEQSEEIATVKDSVLSSEDSEVSLSFADNSEQFTPLAIVSSILFASPKAIKKNELLEKLEINEDQLNDLLLELKERYLPLGIEVKEIGEGIQLRTLPGIGKTLQKFFPPKARRLTRAASETLAVIAYRQPIQRAEIEAIRGVDALPTIKSLMELKLIRIVGHEPTVGQPALYGTTEVFLEKFGLKDLSELPTIREAEELLVEPGEFSAERKAEQEELEENTSADLRIFSESSTDNS